LLSFVNVTDRADGLPVVPPGAITAGLVELQPIWPPPQITIEYGLFGVALAGDNKTSITATAARSAKNVTRSLPVRIKPSP
jgi:hypothetical protein